MKALAIYRDGSKTAQALRTDAQDDKDVEAEASAEVAPPPEPKPFRRRMPRERQSITHKFSIGGHEGYITAGMYEDGTIGEIFLTDIGKEGSTLRGMMNSFATAISISLQYGVPLETLVRKFCYMRFDPEGITNNPEIPFASRCPTTSCAGSPRASSMSTLRRSSGSSRPRSARQDGAGRADARRHGRAVERRERQRRQRQRAASGAGPKASTSAPAAKPAPGGSPPEHVPAPSAPGTTKAAAEAFTDEPPVMPAKLQGLDLAGVRSVWRDDAAHGVVLHVLELREQHGLRVAASAWCVSPVIDPQSRA